MKRLMLISILTLMLIPFVSISQTNNTTDLAKQIAVMNNIAQNQRYKIYPTTNMYNFLRLDTKTGKVDMVQWSMERNNEGSVAINDADLTLGSNEYTVGSFELISTDNFYTFLLLDKKKGNVYHLQWGFEEENRWCRLLDYKF